MVLFVDRRRRESRYELVELLRKLILISILAAISPKSTTFLYTAHVVSFFYFGLFAYMMPSAEPSVARLQFMTLGVTALTIFYGIMLKAPDGGVGSDVDSNERTARVTRPRLYCAPLPVEVAGSSFASAGDATRHHERFGLRAAALRTFSNPPQASDCFPRKGNRMHPQHPAEAGLPSC
jgi:hypothetical protein